MSYVSLLKNIPEILSQPTGIAAIASVGIHGAMALIVPLMPMDSNQSKNSTPTKAVGVMELSQADQQRLPQPTNPSQVALQPQFPIQSQFPPSPVTGFNSGATLPVLPPPPASSQLILPPIPNSPTNYGIASLPKGQSLRIVPRPDLRFDTSGFNANSKFPPAPRFNSGDIAIGQAQPLPINKLPTLPGGRIPDGLPNTPPPLPSESTANSPLQNNTTPPTTPTGDTQNGQLIAGIGNTPQAGDDLTLGKETIPTWQQGSRPQVPELPAKITGQEISQVNSYEDLRKTVQEQYPSLDEKAVIRDTINTDKPGLEGTIIGGLVVDADGKVLDIKFQDKSVSGELLLKAREYFSANPPKGHSKTSYYPFSLRFQNNGNTAGASQQPLPTPAASNKPALTTPDANSKQPVSVPTVNDKPALTTPDANSKQPVTAPPTTSKPLSELLLRRKQPVTAPTATDKPAQTAPAVNNKQPITAPAASDKPAQTAPAVNNKQPITAPAASDKPAQTTPAINNKQPVSAPAATDKPAQTAPDVNSKQPVPAPAVTRKPLSELLQRRQQPAPTPAATEKPTSAADNNSNQSAPSVESSKKLILQLRELKEKRESTSQQQ